MSTSFDAITPQSLREAGGMKWSAFPESIGAFVAEMDFGVAPPIEDALHAWVDRGLFGYMPTWLSDDLKAATAEYYSTQYGWPVAPHLITPIPDVIKGFEIAIEHFSPPGSKVIIPTPAYMPFFKVPTFYDREVIEVPMIRTAHSWEFDVDAIDDAFSAGGGLLIICNPHNPIGKVYSEGEMLELSAIVEKHGGRVFSDEIHAPLVFEPARHRPYASLNATTAGHTITATSASKAWNLPGLKCAQLILSNDHDEQTLTDLGPFVGHGTANPGALANIAAYRAGQPWLDEVLTYLQGNREFFLEQVAEHLPMAKVIRPDGTYLAWIDLTDLNYDGNLGDFFLKNAGVAMVDGDACGKVGADAVRFNFALPRPLIAESLSAMGAAVRTLDLRYS